MIEVTGNLWTFQADYRVITTNGAVRSDGCCVMGRGCAREAKDRYPRLAWELGQHIKTVGNHVRFWMEYGLYTFPVKHSWEQPADPILIERSVNELLWLLQFLPIVPTLVMPRPGCGNGNLKWGAVRPLIERLPDNVFVIDFAPKS